MLNPFIEPLMSVVVWILTNDVIKAFFVCIPTCLHSIFFIIIGVSGK